MAENREKSLLDTLAEAAGLGYLSDLPNIQGLRLMKVVRTLKKIPPEAYPLWVWNDALHYIAKAPANDSAEQARKALLDYLTA